MSEHRDHEPDHDPGLDLDRDRDSARPLPRRISQDLATMADLYTATADWHERLAEHAALEPYLQRVEASAAAVARKIATRYRELARAVGATATLEA